MKTQKKGIRLALPSGTNLKIACCCCCRYVHSFCSLLHLGPPNSFHLFPPTGWYNIWPTPNNHDAHTSMTTDQLPDKVHQTASETKYHVFNNLKTDNVDIYHSEATRLIPNACTMKYTKNIRTHTVTTHIQPQNPEIIYEHLPYCSYQPYSFKCDKYISMVT